MLDAMCGEVEFLNSIVHVGDFDSSDQCICIDVAVLIIRLHDLHSKSFRLTIISDGKSLY